MSAVWSQRAEWNDGPSNVSMPGMSGRVGSESCPTALTRTSTDSDDPPAKVTVQLLVSASHAAAVTSRP
jgi:hypothetical protein